VIGFSLLIFHVYVALLFFMLHDLTTSVVRS
jgi:hypothetical protein